MATGPSRIIWSQEALSRFEELEDRTREEILRRVRFLTHHPMMYQVETRPPWAGLRRFRAAEVIVFHTYWHEEHTVYIEAIVPARSGVR